MSSWLRGLALALGLFCMGVLASAEASPEMEKQAEDLFQQGEGRMKVASYEEAITEFNNVLIRYPDTNVRYKAQFRIADAMVGLKREPEALTLLQSVVKEESPEWSPQALSRIGGIYVAGQKFSDAFRAYRQIITDYPDSPLVDRAHYSIGVTHFKLGHFELAAAELEKVGTAYASRIPELQRVSPGEPLFAHLIEPNTVALTTTTLIVTVTATSGDKETITLLPEAEGSDRFSGSIPTVLGTPKAADGILQLHGNDTITLAYKSRYVGVGAVDKTVPMTIASNGRLVVRNSDKQEVRAILIDDPTGSVLEVFDPDRDVSDKADTVAVDIKTKRKDTEKFTLTETGPHTGVFQAVVIPERLKPDTNVTPGNGKIESNANPVEGSLTKLDDDLTITYQDEMHLTLGVTGSRKVTATVAMMTSTEGSTTPVDTTTTGGTLDIAKLLGMGRALSKIAVTYRDLGQEEKAKQTFRDADDQYAKLLAKYPNAPEVEEAMYGRFTNYVAADDYGAAFGMIGQINRRFPQSTRAPQALFELADLHVKHEEFDRALAIYQNLVQSAKGKPLAEDAHLAICSTYMRMYKPPIPGEKNTQGVSAEQVTYAFEEFVRAYPNSDRAPDALWQLVNFRYNIKEYRGAADSARRLVALFPDHVLAGRALMMQGKSQVEIGDYAGAEEAFTRIMANYGDLADDVTKARADAAARSGRTRPRTTTTTPPAN